MAIQCRQKWNSPKSNLKSRGNIQLKVGGLYFAKRHFFKHNFDYSIRLGCLRSNLSIFTYFNSGQCIKPTSSLMSVWLAISQWTLTKSVLSWNRFWFFTVKYINIKVLSFVSRYCHFLSFFFSLLSYQDKKTEKQLCWIHDRLQIHCSFTIRCYLQHYGISTVFKWEITLKLRLVRPKDATFDPAKNGFVVCRTPCKCGKSLSSREEYRCRTAWPGHPTRQHLDLRRFISPPTTLDTACWGMNYSLLMVLLTGRRPVSKRQSTQGLTSLNNINRDREIEIP